MRLAETTEQRNQRVFGTDRPVALVTGSAAPRVGNVIAQHLCNQNFQVVAHRHRNRATDDPSEIGFHAVHIVAGAVEDEATVTSWKDEVLERFGRVDLLVNSAAVWKPVDLEQTHAQDFEHQFRVNCLGTAMACKYFGLAMAKQPHGGAIINIGDWAVDRPYRGFAAYFASKGTIATLTQSMAVELATRNANVRVNAIFPGPVMLAEEIDDARRDQIVRECLLQREGTAHDVAEAALFLATNQFVTGVCLPVDGGRTIYAGPSADPIAHPDVSG